MNKPFVAPTRSDILYLCQLRCRQHRNNIRIAYKYFLKLFIFILTCALAAHFSFKYQFPWIGYGFLTLLFLGPLSTGFLSRYRHLHNHQEFYADFHELKEQIKKDRQADQHIEKYYQTLQAILAKPLIHYQGKILPH